LYGAVIKQLRHSEPVRKLAWESVFFAAGSGAVQGTARMRIATSLRSYDSPRAGFAGCSLALRLRTLVAMTRGFRKEGKYGL